jgi:hypothetical protein
MACRVQIRAGSLQTPVQRISVTCRTSGSNATFSNPILVSTGSCPCMLLVREHINVGTTSHASLLISSALRLQCIKQPQDAAITSHP